MMDLHSKAQKLASELKRYESQLLVVLMEMAKRKQFFQLGYRGIFDYVVNALKLSEAQAYYYQKVAQKSVEVPALKKAVVEGDLSLSKARRIVPVMSKRNADRWIEKAKKLPQRQLEAAVAEVNPATRVKERVKPVGPKLVEMTVSVSPEVAALLKRVQDLESQRLKKAASWEEALKAAAEVYLEKNDPVRKAERLSSRKPKVVLAKQGRHPIPAQIAHGVSLRDKGQCSYRSPGGKRCKEKRWLERDHVRPVSRGGLNTVENLQTLCRFHHRRKHAPVIARVTK